MDALWAPTVGYADDVIILSSTKDDGVKMLVDCTEISAELGLDVGMEKTNWTSTEPRQNEVLKIGKDEIKWSGSITFLGTVLEFGGHDAKALQYRTGQETKKIAMWAPLIFSKWLPLDKRMITFKTAIGSSLTGLAGTWHLTKAQASKLKSLAARTAAWVKGIRRAPGRDMATFLRNLHREGHRLLERFNADLVREHCLQEHRLRRHIARMASSTIPKIAMTTKPLARWRVHQQKGTDKHSGLHPKRFECWRWETQFENWCGIAKLVLEKSSLCEVGWLGKAANRNGWKEDERSFANSTQP